MTSLDTTTFSAYCRQTANQKSADAASTPHERQTASSLLSRTLQDTLEGVVLLTALSCFAACSRTPTDCVANDAGTDDQVSVNFNAGCRPIVRTDIEGSRLDAHEATLEVFNGQYFLYGTSWECGFVWQQPGTPFCGFHSYSSSDLIHWKDNGLIFDASTSAWQSKCGCGGARCGCFRPHVVYNEEHRSYVLWFNGNDVPVSYHVMVSPNPTGPFEEVGAPTLAVNNQARVEIPNNGDPSIFVDEDNVAYLSYTDWKREGDIVVERLDSSYTSGTGDYVRLGLRHVEAPTMFRRNGTYYLLYSDPNCGLCGATGTSARRSASPLGPWSTGRKISEDSCGGQPSHVTRVLDKVGVETFLFQSDLWDPDGEGDQRKANHYWGPLEFSDNEILNIRCLRSFVPPVL